MQIDKTITYRVSDYTFTNFINLDENLIKQVWQWRNAPEIREYMYNREIIPLANHLRFIIDKSIGGPDAAFSMVAEEFHQMVEDIRIVEKSLGSINYPTDPKTIEGRTECRSLYVAEDMKAGDVITEYNVRSVRPGYGLHPKYLPELLGKTVNCNLRKGERFSNIYVKL